MSAELLPCPFCGAVAEEHQVTDYNDVTVIECQNEECGARNMLDNALLARRAWNRRHTIEAGQPDVQQLKPKMPLMRFELYAELGCSIVANEGIAITQYREIVDSIYDVLERHFGH